MEYRGYYTELAIEDSPTLDIHKPCIHVVATPIGNLQDLSERAKAVLSQAQLILCEDTRQTLKLFHHLELPAPKLESYHDYNERAKAEGVVAKIIEQELVAALVSDAGTPCVSDPGYHLIKEAHRRGLRVCPVPGPSAVVSLVSASGLPSDRFTFVGFLPQKEASLQKAVGSWAGLGAVVFYEAANRLVKTLEVIRVRYPQSSLTIGRELTKMHEEVFNGGVEEILIWASNHTHLKGEVVAMISLGEPQEEVIDLEALKALAEDEMSKGASVKDLIQRFAPLGFNRKELYKILLDIKQRL